MSFALTAQAAFQYWAQLDCPTSLKLWLMARADQWAEVLTSKVDPENFADPLEYAKANAAVSFLKKCRDVPSSSDEERLKSCVSSWRAGEASCFWANERLQPYVTSPLSDEVPAEFLRRVRRQLLSWLRHAPDDAEMHRRMRHGPGTTFSSSVPRPTAADKFDGLVSLTSGAVWHLANIVGTKWGAIAASRYGSLPNDGLVFVRGNRFAAVPKTALTDRGIAIEASLNVYAQLGIGSAIRSRLRRYAGWDLDNASATHRKIVKQASIDGSLATIDLSNASDSLCKNLVRVLLRDTLWLEYMEDLRSPMTLVDGKWHLLEKFSSMGNGYTFELETCVFAAILSVCLQLKGHAGILGHDFYVFGDDLIVPTDVAEFVVATLRWCGFETNSSKTFLRGSFRESCGADFFNGYPVRGYYLKEALSYGSQRIFSLFNGAKICLGICGVNSPWYLDWIRRNYLPLRLREVGGSERLGDSVLHGIPARERWRNGIRWVKCVRWSKPITVRWSYFSIDARLACRLTGAGDTLGINSRGSLLASELTWVTDS